MGWEKRIWLSRTIIITVLGSIMWICNAGINAVYKHKDVQVAPHLSQIDYRTDAEMSYCKYA